MEKINQEIYSYSQCVASGELRKIRTSISQIQDNVKFRNRNLRRGTLLNELQNYDEFRTCYLLFSTDKFVRAFIKSKRKNIKLIYPLPIEWQNILENNGIFVHRIRCLILFKLVKVISFLKELCKTLSLMTPNISKSKKKLADFVLIRGINSVNCQKNSNFNFANWALKEEIFQNTNDVIYISSDKSEISVHPRFKKVNSMDYIFLKDFNSFVSYLGFITKQILTFKLSILHIKYAKIIMQINKVVEGKVALPKYILTTSSESWIKNPLDKFLEKEGSISIYVNLSLAIEPNLPSENAVTSWHKFSKWKEIWCVNDIQRDFFKLDLCEDDVRFKVVGVPDWIDSTNFQLSPPNIDKGKTISIFDYEPTQDFLGYSTINDLGITDFVYLEKFLLDIVEIAKKYDFKVLHKPKRHIGSRRNPRYSHLLENLIREKDNYVLIDPSVSPRKLISNSKMSISMPFTSTALICKESNFSSIYYDPSSTLFSCNASSKVKIVKGKQQLDKYIQKNI